jgi:hydrogenase-4 component B
VVGDELAWAYPVGTPRVRLDTLGAFFLAWSLLMTLLGSIYVVVYLRPYFGSKRHVEVHYALPNLTSLSFVLGYTADRALVFRLGWETAALAAWLLVFWNYTRRLGYAGFNRLTLVVVLAATAIGARAGRRCPPRRRLINVVRRA